MYDTFVPSEYMVKNTILHSLRTISEGCFTSPTKFIKKYYIMSSENAFVIIEYLSKYKSGWGPVYSGTP